MGALATAVKTNDRRKSLIALRNTIAKELDVCDSGRDIAALSKRLMEVMVEIDTLPDPKAKANPLREAQMKASK